MTARILRNAIGDNDGDTLTIGNNWASIAIRRDDPIVPGAIVTFETSGDCEIRSFPTITQAVHYALTTLGTFNPTLE